MMLMRSHNTYAASAGVYGEERERDITERAECFDGSMLEPNGRKGMEVGARTPPFANKAAFLEVFYVGAELVDDFLLQFERKHGGMTLRVGVDDGGNCLNAVASHVCRICWPIVVLQ